MKAIAIRPYRCLCIECERLPPIEGLHPLTYGDEADGEIRKPRGILAFITGRVMPSRRRD